MSRARALVLAFALVPLGPAAAFEGEMEDRRDDVESLPGRAANSTSTDVLRFRSSVNGTTVEQRVEMAAPPDAARDSIIVRSWFRNSTDGTSFYVIDLEVHAEAAAEDDRFRSFTRRGAFENVTPIEASYALEGAEWIFRFDSSVAPDAECFLPMVYAFRSSPSVFDSLGMTGRPCETAPEPIGGAKPELPASDAGSGREPEQEPGPELVPAEPPGTRSPAFGISIVGFLLVILLLLALRRR